jgi:hypothetical protein
LLLRFTAGRDPAVARRAAGRDSAILFKKINQTDVI